MLYARIRLLHEGEERLSAFGRERHSEAIACKTHFVLRWLGLCAGFFVPFAIYYASRVIVITDSLFVLPTAISLVRDGDTNVDEFVNGDSDLFVSTTYQV